VPFKLDAIDRRILNALQHDGRLPNNELARRVGLSPSPCLRRVRLLEENGVIERYTAVINTAKIGLGMTVFARVWLTGQDEDQVDRFIEEVGKLSQIVECHLMAGDCDFLLRIVAEDLEGVRRFQSQHLARIKGVQSIKTDIPMQRFKDSQLIPLLPDFRPTSPRQATA
jgi:Lrp/AsnC family transcriptional regulator, leucine-responsive regulatory protein